MPNDGNRLRSTARNCAKCHLQMRGQAGQRYCVVWHHNVDQQLRNLAAKCWTLPNKCPMCGGAKYHHHLANDKETRQCKSCSHAWTTMLRDRVQNESPFPKKSTGKSPICNNCSSHALLEFGEFGSCLNCGELTDLLLVSKKGKRATKTANRLRTQHDADPSVALRNVEATILERVLALKAAKSTPEATPQLSVEKLPETGVKNPVSKEAMLAKAGPSAPQANIAPRLERMLKALKTAQSTTPPVANKSTLHGTEKIHAAANPSALHRSPVIKPKMQVNASTLHRTMSAPQNTEKLVNQQLSGSFGKPEPRKVRDTVAPTANKRIVRAIVQDNNGQEEVAKLRQTFSSPQTVGNPPMPEDFRFVRNLHLPPYLFVKGTGPGVWVEVPALMKSPKMEFLDIAWLAMINHKPEQRLKLALVMGKLAMHRRHKQALRSQTRTNQR
nr:hypothetical protein [Leuven Tombus-like virus 5]